MEGMVLLFGLFFLAYWLKRRAARRGERKKGRGYRRKNLQNELKYKIRSLQEISSRIQQRIDDATDSSCSSIQHAKAFLQSVEALIPKTDFLQQYQDKEEEGVAVLLELKNDTQLMSHQLERRVEDYEQSQEKLQASLEKLLAATKLQHGDDHPAVEKVLNAISELNNQRRNMAKKNAVQAARKKARLMGPTDVENQLKSAKDVLARLDG